MSRPTKYDHETKAPSFSARIGEMKWNVAGVCVMRLLSVSPVQQKQGVGKGLMREIERVATEIVNSSPA